MGDTWRLDGGNIACETVGIGSRKQQVEGAQYKCYTQHICCNFHFLTALKDYIYSIYIYVFLLYKYILFPVC